MTDLRSLDLAATPGPWRIGFYAPHFVPCDAHYIAGADGVTIVDADNDGPDISVANSQYIAACDPTTILALLDRAEKAEAELAAAHKTACAHHDETRRIPNNKPAISSSGWASLSHGIVPLQSSPHSPHSSPPNPPPTALTPRRSASST